VAGLLAKALTVSAVLGLLVTGCSSGGGTQTAQSATPSNSGSSSSAAPGSGSVTPTNSAAAPTPTGTAPAIHGTATDFCSAIAELGTGISASRSSGDAVGAIYGSVADWRRFAPDSLKSQVKTVGDELIGVAQNLAVGLYSSNQALAAAVHAALTSPDGHAIGQYSIDHCR